MTQGWVLLTLFLLYHDVKDVRPESNVGCFFNPRLCGQEEHCYDDNAFGRCQVGYDEGGDIYRYNLTPDTLRLLQQEMKRLFNGGYRWSHDYTQCVMQNILYTDRHHLMYDPGLCSRVLKLTLPAVPSEVAEELEHVSPQDLAYISFNPSKIDAYSDYADETYIPPVEEPRYRNVYAFDGDEDVTYQGKVDKRDDRIPDSRRSIISGLENQIFLEYLRELLQDADEALREKEKSHEYSSQELPPTQVDLLSALKEKPIFTEGGTEWVSVEDRKEPDVQEESEGQLSSLLMTNPEIWRKETADKKPMFISHLNELIEKKGNNKDRWRSLQGDNLINDVFSQQDGRFDEDENVWLKNANFLKILNTHPEFREHINPVDNVDPEIEEDLVGKFMDGFERPMRYDAKKPGPAYYVHEPESSEIGYQNDVVVPNDIMKALSIGGENSFPSLTPGVVKSQHPPFSQYAEENELALKQLVSKSHSTPHLSSVSMTTDTKPEEFVFRDESEVVRASKTGKNGTNRNTKYYEPLAEVLPSTFSTAASETPGELKPVIVDAINNSDGQYEAVDSSLAYLLMDSTLTTEEGSHLAKHLEKLLKLPRGTFSNVRVKKKQVIFKVNPNPKGLNASTVARKAEELTGEIQKTTGKSVMSAGIGDKFQFEVVNKESSSHRLFILSFVLCGCVVGVLIAVAVLYVVRRHARSRQKLQNLGLPETEASQDYQDLCRQRMASKTNEKPEPGVVSQSPKRISSLSQSEASQPSPSSRSSTSSWNEEPVTSNMDISTGHMILSYMEDHLKNRDRLDREWEALCAYEAEPCSTTAASLPQNVKKNRYPDVLPYDHSRVVLNDFSNICGSDYINASTITDHDPRNPAYIATQGPLPHTAADFWQMVWEQGSVVVVMLTRLMENGVAMCHRYWPEEGSEVYHIYEVHLVSEHIWCDDYLVRSFYLKNLKTSETRTVTQFHFLSWPENGVPSSTKALLEFRRKVNKSYRGRSCPIMVHCSDGIGRTGTYCLIDMVLNRMAKGAKEIDIAATLEHIRDQRGGTVKTKAQFEFVLMAIAEEVHAILKALSQ